MVFYPMEPSDSYVDRPKFRSDVLDLIKSGLARHIFLGDTQAIYGIGKTTSLAKLYYELKAIDDPNTPKDLKALAGWMPLWLSLDDFSIRQTNEKIIDKGSLAALKQNFEDYKKMLVLLGEQIAPQAFSGLASRLEDLTGKLFDEILSINVQAKGGDVDIGVLAKIAESDLKGGEVKVNVTVENWELILREALKSKITLFTQEFLKILNPLRNQTKFILLADDYDSILGFPIGDWFLDLDKQMDNTVTLLARTSSENDLNWDKKEMVEFTLIPFSLDEVSKYMRQREIDLTDAQIEKVYKFSKSGHPLLVCLAGDLLAGLDRRGMQDKDVVLDRLVGKPKFEKDEATASSPIDEEDLKKRIHHIIDELRIDIIKYDPLLLYGLDVIAVARKFDYNLLKYIFTRHLQDMKEFDEATGEETAERLAHEMIVRLPEYSIVQGLEDRDQQESVYRVNFLVREGMEKNLLEDEPPEYSQQMHQLLADYYQAKELDNMKQIPEYAAMFRLEHLGWQNDMIEWLHHLYSLKDRSWARLQLCKLFLEAFDWWGWLMAFDFCDHLLEHWQQTQPEEDQEVIQLLQEFQKAYPPGYVKQGKGNLKIVHKSMLNLIAELKLDLPVARMDSTQRMVSGHIHRFLADAYRFFDPPNFAQAEAAYNASKEYFEVSWNKDWIISYLADLNLDWMKKLKQAGSSSLALEKALLAENNARESNQMALEEENYLDQDHELMSQNWRILGSVAFYREDWSKAFQAFTRSIAHAYIFHFLKDNQDEYSYLFYHETGKQVLEAVQMLLEQGNLKEASQACQTLRDFWEQQAPFYSDEIFTRMAADFDLNLALSGRQADLISQYILPVIPMPGTEGDAIETGVAVSQTIAEIL